MDFFMQRRLMICTRRLPKCPPEQCVISPHVNVSAYATKKLVRQGECTSFRLGIA